MLFLQTIVFENLHLSEAAAVGLLVDGVYLLTNQKACGGPRRINGVLKSLTPSLIHEPGLHFSPPGLQIAHR
jgi:hypothetical protein